MNFESKADYKKAVKKQINSMDYRSITTKLYNVLYHNDPSDKIWLKYIIKNIESINRCRFSIGLLIRNCNAYHCLAITANKTADDKLKLFDVLIKTDCNINAVDNMGFTPLHYAAKLCKDERLVEKFLFYGSNINACNSYGTPLMLAIQKLNKSVIKLLLDSGADPCTNSRWYNVEPSPLKLAKKSGDVEVVEMVQCAILVKNSIKYPLTAHKSHLRKARYQTVSVQ